ncbi:MAG: hypothetical protein AB2814_11155 [Candidatus Sedimenticola endophacoides]
MNTIANLTRSDPVLAEGVVEDLSDLFRASLGDAARPGWTTSWSCAAATCASSRCDWASGCAWSGICTGTCPCGRRCRR